MTHPLEQLAMKCEGATAGSRNLDFEIAKTLGWTVGSLHYVKSQDGTPYGAFPEWSQSLDAALTLVPEGWDWELSYINGLACAKLGDPMTFSDCCGATPALALTAACLKSRAALSKDQPL